MVGPALRACLPSEEESELWELFLEVNFRFAWSVRSRRWWLLRLNPFRECWRMARLCGVSLREQIDTGWAVAPCLRQMVCLPEAQEDWAD
jgi:hypothetical protein